MQASKVYELENLLVLLMSDLDANRQSPHWRAMRRHCQRITQTTAKAPIGGQCAAIAKESHRQPPTPIGGQCAAIAKESRKHPPTPHWRAMRRHCQRITQTTADAPIGGQCAAIAKESHRHSPTRKRRSVSLHADNARRTISTAFPWSTARHPRDEDRS